MAYSLTKIKICGITRMEDALQAVQLGADALGFNFFPESPRYITPQRAWEIISQLPPFVTPVGVFVNAAQEEIDEALAASGARVAQLHGDESPEFCRSCKCKVIKAFRVGDQFDLARLAEYPVSAFLLDTYRKGLYGGTGATFDWEIAREAGRYGPIILAGGLSPDNIEEAIRSAHPYAVDVNSGVESEPGVKDHAKMEAVVATARAAR